jgi:ATP-dependent exoDNAse (exonuclease V) alpha subunit
MVPQQATIEGLIDEIYPGVSQPQHDDYFVDRAILATKNSDVQIINDLVSEQFPGAGRQYLSADSITDAETGGVFPTEFLNTLSPNGIPPHELTIKLGMPIMLLRNLNPHLGLCNGTRLIVTRLRPHSIEAKVAVGKSKGLIVFLHRLNLSPASSTLPFDLVRRQFPIKPCFAMTINKSQGQTIDKLGVCLQSPAFSHGQLYVALSRVKNVNNIKVLAPDNIMTNIVYAGLLS